jgi:hypothetical protein
MKYLLRENERQGGKEEGEKRRNVTEKRKERVKRMAKMKKRKGGREKERRKDE